MIGRNKVPGLRKISRQVINTIRACKRALTYKEVSDLVTAKNYQSIIDECEKRSPDLSFDSAITKPKDGGIASSAELGEVHARAIENYRRRIYDAWSVLRATNIIVKAD